MNTPHLRLFADAVADVAAPAANGAAAAAPAIGTHWASSWVKPDFTLDHSALERLPENHKGLKEVLSRQKTFDDVLTVMQHQQQLNGKKGLAPLPPDASEVLRAERKTHMDQINGVPPTPKDYGLTKPDDLPESAWHPKLVENAMNWAHKHSVSPAALKELVGMNLASAKEQLTGYADQERQFLADQQAAFEGQIRQDNIPLDRATALVERGATALGLDVAKPETQMLLKNTSVRLMAMRHALATGEDTTVTNGGGGMGGGEPLALAEDIQRNPANPLYAQYWNKDSKFSRTQQEAAVAKVNELHRQHAARNGGRK